MATKGCGQLTSNDTYFSDSWFSPVKISEEAIAAGVKYCGPVKMAHNVFFIDPLENLMKDCPGGYLVMKIYPIVPGGITLMDMGYK